MRRGNRTRRLSATRAVCAACLVGSLAACSSGGHPTSTASTSTSTTSTTTTTVPPTTTLPSAASIATVKAWFAAHGQPLIRFEQIAEPLATGTTPTAAACLTFLKTDLPSITKNPNTLVPLAQSIPNQELERAIYADVAQKLLVGRGCGEAVETNRTIPAGTAAAWRSVRAFSVNAHLWLSRFQISI